MIWELEFIKALQSGSNRFFDYVMYFFTQAGTEIFFMAVALLFYWCINKREGYKYMNLFFASQIIVGAVKILVARPRPYLREYVGVDAIMERTGGYSFPSGHSNNVSVATVFCSDYARRNGSKRAFSITTACFIVLTILTMFSRVYLGQHYPTDVLCGMCFGVGLSLLGIYLFDLFGAKEEQSAYFIVPICFVLTVFGVLWYIFEGDSADAILKVAGIYMAIGMGYFLEKRNVKYEVKADKFYKYVLRMILGVAILFGLRTGLKYLFGLCDGVIGYFLSEFVRYFILGIFVSLLAPMLFKKLKI